MRNKEAFTDMYLGMLQSTKVVETTPKLLIQKRTPASFMVCPLCGTLNVKENEECCACSWSGKFDTNEHVVQIKMWEMVDRSPELQMMLLKELRRPRWKDALYRIKSLFRRKIDIRA